MAQTESTVKLIFEGVERGVAAAAAKAGAAVKALSGDTDRLNKVGDKAGTGLANVGKGMLAISSAGAATSVLAGTAVAAAQMSGALLLLPAASSVAKIGLGALNMAAGDFMTAIGNLDDDKKFNKAMKGMGDSAKEFAGEIKYVHDRVAEGLSEALFEGLGDKFESMTQNTIPNLQGAMMGIVLSARMAAINLMDMLASAERQKDINKLISDSSAIWDGLLSSVTPLGEAFLDISVVGSEMLVELTAGAGDAAQKFADFIAKARETGRLREWISGGLDAFGDLAVIVKNVGDIIGLVFKGLSADMGSPLDRIKELTASIEEFLRTASAQEGLRALGEMMRTVGEVVQTVLLTAMKELAPLLVALAPTIEVVAKTIGDMLVVSLQILGPILTGVATVLGVFPGVVSVATVAIVGFAAALKGMALVNSAKDLLGIGAAVDDVGKKAEGAGGKVGGFHGKLGLLKTLGTAAAVAAIAVEMDNVNTAAAGGAQNLTGWDENLNDIVGAGKQLASMDIGGIFRDIGSELTAWKQNIQTGFNTDGSSNIGKFFGWLKQQMSEPMPPLKFNVETGPAVGQVDAFINDVNSRTPEVNINGNYNGAGFALRTILAEIAAGHEFVTIDGKPMKAQDALTYVMGLINNSTGVVDMNGNKVPVAQALAEMLAQINGAKPVITPNANTGQVTTALSAAITKWNGYTINVNAVVSSRVGGLATGGPVSGPGTGTSDTAGMYALSNGEYVATAQQVRNAGGFGAFGRLMASLDRGPVAGLAQGGPVKFGSVSQKKWDELLRAGWKGRPGDGMEALYPPDDRWGGDRRHYRHAMRGRDDWGWRHHRRRREQDTPAGATVHFSGNTDTALATALQKMIRVGKIQLR